MNIFGDRIIAFRGRMEDLFWHHSNPECSDEEKDMAFFALSSMRIAGELFGVFHPTPISFLMTKCIDIREKLKECNLTTNSRNLLIRNAISSWITADAKKAMKDDNPDEACITVSKQDFTRAMHRLTEHIERAFIDFIEENDDDPYHVDKAYTELLYFFYAGFDLGLFWMYGECCTNRAMYETIRTRYKSGNLYFEEALDMCDEIRLNYMTWCTKQELGLPGKGDIEEDEICLKS